MPFRPVPRLAAFDYVGMHRYFLTICTVERRAVFTRREPVELVRSNLARTSEREQFAVIVYCFMPDHLHVLLEAMREDADFKRFVRVFKQCSSFAWKRKYSGDLWQRSYFDHVLRDHEDMFGVARYILENPVRAGLAADATAYPFSGSFTLALKDAVFSVQL